MNDEDDLLFGVKPSPPQSPRQQFQNKEEEPLVETVATLNMTLNLSDGQAQFGLRYNPEESETIEIAKTRIAKQWNSKSVTLLFEGKKLKDEQLVRDVDAQTRQSASQIYCMLEQANPIFMETVPPIQQPLMQEVPKAQPFILTRDEIVVTQQFVNYERLLFKEYRKQIKTIEKSKEMKENGYSQHYNIDTNLSPDQNFLFSRLPIMDYSFQKRMGLYTASEQIRQNMEEYINGGQNIRFLGYDSILQPSMLFKLIGFMIFFGFNTPGRMKWVCIAICIIYYFHFVRSLYIKHFNQQRALLNLNRQRNQQPVMPANLQNHIDILLRDAGELNENQPRNQVYSVFQIATAIFLNFVLSLNHDWIAEKLQQYQQQRLLRERQLAAEVRLKQEKNEKKQKLKEADLKQKMEVALQFKKTLREQREKVLNDSKTELLIKEEESSAHFAKEEIDFLADPPQENIDGIEQEVREEPFTFKQQPGIKNDEYDPLFDLDDK